MHSRACAVARPYAASSNRRCHCVPPGSDGLRRLENQLKLSSCLNLNSLKVVKDYKNLGYHRDHMTLRQMKSCNLSTVVWLYEQSHLIKWSCMSLKVIRYDAIRWVMLYHFLLVLYSNNTSVLHCLWDIATFSMCMTAYDLEKSFIFVTIVITMATYIFQCLCKHVISNVCHIFQGMRFGEVKNSRSDPGGYYRSLLMAPFDRSRTISY